MSPEKEPRKLTPQEQRDWEPTSEEELDRLAEITPEDIERSKEAWRLHAAREAKDLLDAQPIDPVTKRGEE